MAAQLGPRGLVRALRVLAVAHLRTLALDLDASQLPAVRYHLALLALHLAALLTVSRLAHWPPWIAPLALLVFNLPALARRAWFSETLAPLILVYGLAIVRVALIYGLRREVPAELSYGWALGLSAVWASLIALQTVRRLWLAWVLAGLAAAGLATYLLWRLAPAGVTGSDPYAYVQMALDLAWHGTARHFFPLVPLAAELGLPVLPTTHVGYVLPNAEGWAPTVWPPGYSALLALAYLSGGERALLTLNLWVALASLTLTAALTLLAAPASGRRGGLAAGLGAIALLATSPEQFNRLVVPLADGAAQALTALAVVVTLLAMRAARESRPVPMAGYAIAGLLAGVALAAAYSVRYTQALAGPGLVLVAWVGLREQPRRLAFVVPLAVAALAGALPDLLYRIRLYGLPWRFGTGELALFSARALPEALGRLGAEVLSAHEFGWLWPLALLGAVYAWRRERLVLLAVLAAYGPVLVFHVWYPFLRLRDVLALYVPLAAYTALGGAVLLAWLWRRGPGVRIGLLAGLLAAGLLRLGPLLAIQPGFFTFGYLLPEQRQDLEALRELTEPDAVIASSLNSGAVELYSGRATVRPGNVLQPGAGWTSEQWLTFAAALQATGRPLYVLVDSPEVEAPLADLLALYPVRLVARLDVPVYFQGGASQNLTVPLYKVVWDEGDR